MLVGACLGNVRKHVAYSGEHSASRPIKGRVYLRRGRTDRRDLSVPDAVAQIREISGLYDLTQVPDV